MEKITFYPDKDLSKWLKQKSKDKKLSVNKIILQALETYKSREDRRTFRLEKRDIGEIKKLLQKQVKGRMK